MVVSQEFGDLNLPPPPPPTHRPQGGGRGGWGGDTIAGRSPPTCGACGLGLVLRQRKVKRKFIVFVEGSYPTPPPGAGLWSGSCGLNQGLEWFAIFVEGS